MLEHSSREQAAWRITMRGIVQGVGFRPFVWRLARELNLDGWVRNTAYGVEILAQGTTAALEDFLPRLQQEGPQGARISQLDRCPTDCQPLSGFEILQSQRAETPTAGISPDLAVCQTCLQELFDPADRRHNYPYINCTNCGPRYSIIQRLPYDRPHTTMADWRMCTRCQEEYDNPRDRRFHAQPVACADCGPDYWLRDARGTLTSGVAAIQAAAAGLRRGQIVAVKGIGGYHLACDASQTAAVQLLRTRKFRREQAFAVMVRELEQAEELAELTDVHRELLTSVARPIVLARRLRELPGVAPDNSRLGIMLPYAPLHALLFACGAPSPLVMTSGNRSGEPIAYTDDDALDRLRGIVDLFLVGQRPISRRVDDSVIAVRKDQPCMLRRSRGYAPQVIADLSVDRPVLALGADLKNAVAIVVRGEVLVSQHLGDLDDYACRLSFEQTIEDLLCMYDVARPALLVAHDLHPQYVSTRYAQRHFPGQCLAVQHHHAHIASVLCEHERFDQRVVGLALDGTGYGTDGSIWGCEVLLGSLRGGFEHVSSLAKTSLPGGDAAARYPVQALAGFVSQLSDLPDLQAGPFAMPPRFFQALQLAARGIRCHASSSAGRLFDAVAALLGFTREISFEGQAAMWLEHLAEKSPHVAPYAVTELHPSPIISHVLQDRVAGRPAAEIARAFHVTLAQALVHAVSKVAPREQVKSVAISGGVFQNELLTASLIRGLEECGLEVLCNESVPAGDGGVCLGQAALAALWRQNDRV